MAYKYVSPKFLNDGCVLSLIASKANKGSVPLTTTSFWSDLSTVGNTYNYTNSVSNGGLENDFTGWTTSGSLTISSEYVKSGVKSAKYVLSASAAYGYQDLTFNNGDKIYCSAWCYLTAYTSGNLGLQAYDKSGFSNINAIYSNGVILNTWQQLGVIKTAANGGVRVLIGAGSNATLTGYIDDVFCVNLTALGIDHLTAVQCHALFNFTETTGSARLANNVGMNNLGGTVGTRFDKVAVVNGNGDSAVYTNIQVSNNMDTTTGFVAVGSPISTLAVSNNVMTVTSNSTTGGVRLPNLTVGLLNNKRYYFALNVKVTGTTVSALLFDGLTSTIKSHTGGGAYEKLSGIKLAGQDYNSNPFRVLDNRASGTVDIKQALLVNLSDNTYIQALETKLGRVLTVDECDLLFTFTATTGTVVVDTQYALTLDGSDDYGAIANTPSLDITTNEFALACTFRVANGSSNGSLIAKASSNFTGAQYGLYYDISGTVVIVANGVALGTVSGFVATNTWYNLIVYRNKNGEVAVYLNKAVQTPPATNTDPLVSKQNMRLGGVTTNDVGTTHTGYFKGSMSTMHIYQAPTLDIAKILARETAIAKDYTGVA